MPIKRVRKSRKPLKLSTKGILGTNLKRSCWIIIQKHLQLKEEHQLEFGKLFGRPTMSNWETQ